MDAENQSFDALILELQRRLDVLEEKTNVSCDRHLSQFVAFSELTRSLVDSQKNSLSIPVLRDVLVPLVMRLFAFFAGLTLTMLGGIMGFKWLGGEIFK